MSGLVVVLACYALIMRVLWATESPDMHVRYRARDWPGGVVFCTTVAVLMVTMVTA